MNKNETQMQKAPSRQIPSYLMQPKLNTFETGIAVTVSSLIFVLAIYFLFNSSYLLFELEAAQQLILVLEVLLVVSCSFATWKHAIGRG